MVDNVLDALTRKNEAPIHCLTPGFCRNLPAGGWRRVRLC
jgi:hypothetical protein